MNRMQKNVVVWRNIDWQRTRERENLRWWLCQSNEKSLIWVNEILATTQWITPQQTDKKKAIKTKKKSEATTKYHFDFVREANKQRAKAIRDFVYTIALNLDDEEISVAIDNPI